MEWAKAKTIILILLAALNIFLLSRIILDYGNQGVPRETIANMEKILESRGVRLECEVPRYDKETPKLVFGNGKVNKAAQVEKLLGRQFLNEAGSDVQENTFVEGTKKLTFTGSNSFTYADASPAESVGIARAAEAEEYIQKFLKDKGLDNPTYMQDGEPVRDSDGITFNYIEKYKGFLVFDNYLTVKVSAKGVTYLEVRHKQIKGFSPDKVNDIAAAYQVLLENFTGDEKAVITSVDMGYKDAVDSGENGLQFSEQLPVWRIKVKDSEKPRYFSASDGKEII